MTDCAFSSAPSRSPLSPLLHRAAPPPPPPAAPTRRRLFTLQPFRRPRGAPTARPQFCAHNSFARRGSVHAELSEPPGARKQVKSLGPLDEPHSPAPHDRSGIPDHESGRPRPLSVSETPEPEHAPAPGDAPSEDGGESSSSTVPFTLFGTTLHIPARLLLFSVPFMWGSFGPAVRLMFSQEPHLEPSVFNTLRLFMSTAVYLPILLPEYAAYKASRRAGAPPSPPPPGEEGGGGDRYSFVRAGLELGIYVFLANVAQVLGLQQVSAARAAFLVQLQTVIVPVLSGVLGLEAVRRNTLVSAFIAVAGVALLSLDKGHGAASSLSGDGLEIVSALFFSAYVIRLGSYCNNVRSGPLVATKILVQAVLSSCWAFGMAATQGAHAVDASALADSPLPQWTLPIIALNLGCVAWTGLISSAASGWAQTKGQQKVPPSDAVVIFATQPLWASAIAAVILGESFGPRGIAGGGLIVASTLVASLKSSSTDESDKKED